MKPLQAQVTSGLDLDTDYQIRKEDGFGLLTFGVRFALLLPILGTQLTTLDFPRSYKYVIHVLKMH
jgi:hypothetical protein